jgi:hypothetical protein
MDGPAGFLESRLDSGLEFSADSSANSGLQEAGFSPCA